MAGDPGNEAWFGENVAIEGGTVVVGARHEDLDPVDPDYFDNGAVYVYVRDAGVWTLQQKITSGLHEWALTFGCSVDISGDTLVIGAYDWHKSCQVSQSYNINHTGVESSR